MPGTAGGVAFLASRSTGGLRAAIIRPQGVVIAGIITSLPLPPVTSTAPPGAPP